MENDAESLARAIGARVKQERRAREWTLDELAAHAEVSRRMVVNIEQGAVNPSVGVLLRVSDALGVGLPALVEPPERKPITVVRAGTAPTLWRGEHGGRACLVAGTEPPDVVELWDWTLAPGERHESEPHADGTRELLQVRTGAVTIEVGETTHALASGDALTFFGDEPHAYSNTHDAPAHFSLSVFEPGFGTSHRTEPAHD